MRYGRKSDIGKFNAGCKGVQIQTRFERVWMVFDQYGSVYMSDGSWMPCFEFFLVGFGNVVGPRDISTADNTAMQEAWRSAANAKIQDEINLRSNQ